MRSSGNTWRLLGLATCTLLVLAGGQARASWIDTTIQWNGTNSIGPLGESKATTPFNAATYGERFLIGPTDTHVDNFAFWVHNDQTTGPFQVQAMIYQWDGTKATGPALYNSGPVSVPVGSGFTELKFTPTNLVLNPNTNYVAFLTTSPFFDGTTHTAEVGFIGQNVYKQGAFVFVNNGSDLSKLTTTAWYTAPNSGDLTFRAQLSAGPVSSTPVPSGMLLGALGSCGLLTCAWRRRRQPA